MTIYSYIMKPDQIRNQLKEKGMKVTPQRVAILEAVHRLNNHPTADDIAEFIKKKQPNIAVGTIYKVLDALYKNGIIKKVTTEGDRMRYDGLTEHHHHLYCTQCDQIEDYQDDALNELIQRHFEHKQIKGFTVHNFVLQINGSFDTC